MSVKSTVASTRSGSTSSQPPDSHTSVRNRLTSSLIFLAGSPTARCPARAGNFDELSPRDPLGDVSSGLERYDSVLGALQHERRYPHSAQDVPDVDLLAQRPGDGAAQDERGRPVWLGGRKQHGEARS